MDKTYKMTRATFGNMRSRNGNRNLFSVSYGFTNFKKKPAAGATATILSATSIPTAGTTISTGFTQPDVPRAINVAIAASTVADIKGGTIVVTGRNVEGKVITENFTVTNDTAATVTGSKAFKSITSVLVPAMDGSSVTVSVGTRNLLGLNHRLPSGTTIKVIQMDSSGTQSEQSAPTTAFSTSAVESNTVSPATTPDGTLVLTVHYITVASHLNPTNAQPTYGA